MKKKEPTISSAKVKANRENSRKSTGPKDTSRTKLNALKHGILSKEALIRGEDSKTLERLGKKLRSDLHPRGEVENLLVDRIVSSLWRLKRALRMEKDLLQSEFESCKWDGWNGAERDVDRIWGLVVTRQLGHRTAWPNLTRYETALERQIYRALHSLMEIQEQSRGAKSASS